MSDKPDKDGYIRLVRHPSHKQVLVRADFVALINEAGAYTMWVLNDGNQVYTRVDIDVALARHAAAMDALRAYAGHFCRPAAPAVIKGGNTELGVSVQDSVTGQATARRQGVDSDEIPF